GYFRRNSAGMARPAVGLVRRRELGDARGRRLGASRGSGKAGRRPGALTFLRGASLRGTGRSAHWPLTTFHGIERAMSEAFKWIGGSSVVAVVLLASAVVAGNALEAQQT